MSENSKCKKAPKRGCELYKSSNRRARNKIAKLKRLHGKGLKHGWAVEVLQQFTDAVKNLQSNPHRVRKARRYA